MFCVAADGDIDEYTDSVSAYILHSSALTMSSQKSMLGLSPTKSPGLMVMSLLSSGDLEALRNSRYDLRNAIRDAKSANRDKLKCNYHSSGPRHMWCGLRSITDYKGRNSSDARPASSLPDELNTFDAPST